MELTSAMLMAMALLVGMLAIPFALEFFIRPIDRSKKAIFIRVIFSWGIISAITNVSTLIFIAVELIFDKTCGQAIADELPCSMWVYHASDFVLSWLMYPMFLAMLGGYFFVIFKFGRHVGYAE